MAKFIFIGNYPRDKQESMERFAQMLHHGFQEAGHASEIWRPVVFFGTLFKSTTSGLGKWMGYLDKWILFCFLLQWRVSQIMAKDKEVRFHICDHSNAPYLQYLPSSKTSITCHDVIAIRAAKGYPDTYVTASGFGKILQNWILKHLSSAVSLACVSNLTLSQLKDLSVGAKPEQKDWKVIYNAFNADFELIPEKKAIETLKNKNLPLDAPFILHVGSALPRKNRKLLLDMVDKLGDKWEGNICYAGKPLDPSLVAHVQRLGLEKRVFSIVNPNHATLEALYNTCQAFIFPSYSEGFGWPVIEAQACGTPVIASNTAPMPEVSGGAALYCDPNKPEEFAAALLSLNDSIIQTDLIERGLANCSRFSRKQIIGSYLELHGIKQKEAQLICS
ncbi:glycosyltransferase family 4 protein [Rufibacter roseolus]|uniref:glycosyltransferase family 4 protein n=1 Tax=Rufibacter roseolus TaxID=2817375 RepID=UPI001B30DC43|nr:glycosyltransferase family 1 protein [Rufibacter roseolus]